MSTSSTQADYELIQRFLDFELSEAELAMFEERLTTDVVFQERLARYQEMDKHVDDMHTPEAIVVQLPTVRSIWKRGGAIAAMIVLAIGLLFALRLFSTDHEGVQILAQNYWEEQVERSSQIRSTDAIATRQDSILQLAAVAIDDQNWEMALGYLNQFLSSDDQYIDVLILKGKVYYEQAAYEDAITQYNQIVALHTSRQDEGYWYRALTYIRLEQFEQAKADLEMIVAQDYPFEARAKELLRKL